MTRLLGTESPGEIARAAADAWERETPAGRREAFRRTRALLSALRIERGSDPAETAAAMSRKLKDAQFAEPLAQILRELPEEKGAAPASSRTGAPNDPRARQ